MPDGGRPLRAFLIRDGALAQYFGRMLAARGRRLFRGPARHRGHARRFFTINRFQPREPAGYPTLCKGRYTSANVDPYYAFEEPVGLNASAILPGLKAAGVTALKIEGRQRGRAYVTEVVRAFRAILDALAEGRPPPPDAARLHALNEGGQGNLERLPERLAMSALPRLTLGPLLYHGSAEQRRDFYFRIADEAPVSTVYIGETVFSNRPVGVKRFQTIHHYSVDVAHGLVLLFGIGTTALPSWDTKTRRNNLLGGLAVSITAGPSGHTNSPHPSSREGHHSTARWSSGVLLSYLILGGSHAAATSLVQRNSVPSTHMRCMITASRRASATIAFFIPRRLAIFIAQALSQDHLLVRVSMTWAAS